VLITGVASVAVAAAVIFRSYRRFSCWWWIMHPHTVWFRRNWYQPVEDDSSCCLVDTFVRPYCSSCCTSAGAERAKLRRGGTACFWTMLDGAKAHRRVSSLLILARVNEDAIRLMFVLRIQCCCLYNRYWGRWCRSGASHRSIRRLLCCCGSFLCCCCQNTPEDRFKIDAIVLERVN